MTVGLSPLEKITKAKAKGVVDDIELKVLSDMDDWAAKRLGASAKPAQGGWLVELRLLLRLGWPNLIRLLLEFIPGLAMLFFLGDDVDELAGAGMGFMFANVSGISLIMGSGAGAGPLISQAFGARSFVRCGDLLQRQLAIHAVLVLPIAAVWMRTESILLAMRQPHVVARLTAQFVRWRVAALPFYALKEDMGTYLTAQCATKLPMAASITANIVTVASFPLLIGALGFVGAPLALTLGNALQALIIFLPARSAIASQETWPRWSLKTSLSNWGEMLSMALPAGILMLCEWWGWEINLFFAGLLCNAGKGASCVELDVFPVVSNTMVVGFMLHYGFAMAAGAHVGNMIGAGAPARARRASQVMLALAAAISGVTAALLTHFRREWGSLFSHEKRAVELTAEVLPWVALYIFLDSLGPGALVSCLRGVGFVKAPAVINFVSFYAIGIPFGVWLTFGRTGPHAGIVGLWAGLDVAMLCMVCGLLICLLFVVDWEQASAVAQDRSRATSEPGEDASPKKTPGRVGAKRAYRGVKPGAGELPGMLEVQEGEASPSSARPGMVAP